MTTKEQERKALEKIMKIVAELGEDSYIATAFDGCFEIATENIENDWACSMKDRWETAEKLAYARKERITEMEKQITEMEKQIARKDAELEREQEWKPYEDEHNVTQAAYEKLDADSMRRELSDDEAADMIANEFGFDRSKIVIVHEVRKQEISRHRHLRTVGTHERKSLFCAWDWNYIRFNVIGNVAMGYEMYNGQLQMYWG